MSYEVVWHKEHGLELAQNLNPRPADAEMCF